MSFLSKLFGLEPDPREEMRPLWHNVVGLARDPAWYAQCGVADTVAGRFDMITAILSAVAIRMEELNLHTQSALLCELFVEDMDGQLREFGINDVVVGKHIGRLMSVLGGRMGAYRPALTGSDTEKLEAAVTRNISFTETGDPKCVVGRLLLLNAQLGSLGREELLGGKIALEPAQ